MSFQKKEKKATYHPLKTSLRGISFILNENSMVMTCARQAKAAKRHFLLLQTTKGANPPAAAAALYRQLHSRQRGFMLREQPISSASSALAGFRNVYTTRVQGRRAASPQGSLRGNAGVCARLICPPPTRPEPLPAAAVAAAAGGQASEPTEQPCAAFARRRDFLSKPMLWRMNMFV